MESTTRLQAVAEDIGEAYVASNDVRSQVDQATNEAREMTEQLEQMSAASVVVDQAGDSLKDGTSQINAVSGNLRDVLKWFRIAG